MSNHYVISLNISGHSCLVAGGGKVAARKVKALLDAGAQVNVVSSGITEEIRRFAESGKICLEVRDVAPEDVRDKFLVIAATDDRAKNSAIAGACRKHRTLVNVVDSPEESDFFVPASMRRGDLTIAISTGGKIPALTKKIKEGLGQQFGDEYARYVELLGAARGKIYACYRLTANEKRKALEELLDLELIALLKAGNNEAAEKAITRFLSAHGV